MRQLLMWIGSMILAGTLQAQVPQRSMSPAEVGTQNHGAQMPQASTTSALEQDFFALLRSGSVKGFLSYIPKDGVNVGKDPQHMTREEVEEQMQQRGWLYCKLFDSDCIKSEIQLDNSGVRACSYRELLTKSQKVRTAATETTRNNTRQAILVAEVKNQNCSGVGLIDFIFNYSHGGWKLFSIP